MRLFHSISIYAYCLFSFILFFPCLLNCIAVYVEVLLVRYIKYPALNLWLSVEHRQRMVGGEEFSWTSWSCSTLVLRGISVSVSCACSWLHP